MVADTLAILLEIFVDDDLNISDEVLKAPLEVEMECELCLVVLLLLEDIM
jgi:hypothetical protein